MQTPVIIERKWPTHNTMFCKWLRFRETVDFTRPKTHLFLGQRGKGKSSHLEATAIKFPKIIDLFGSRDNEGLAWCRSPLKESICFIVGDSVEITSDWPSIKVSDLRLKDFKKYRVFLTVHGFYSTTDEMYMSLKKILDVLYAKQGWKEPWFLGCREAGQFIYARLRVNPNQLLAKADFIYLCHEARHMGYAVGVDSIRWTSIDIEVRDVSDYCFVHAVGRKGLPKDLHFVYRYVDPFDMMHMKPDQFVLVTDGGAIGVGRVRYPYWHKEEKENLLKMFGIIVDPGTVPYRGNIRKGDVSDFEHKRIIDLYYPKEGERESMGKIASKLSRSTKTIKFHIDEHEHAITLAGACPRCDRIS